MPIWPSALNLDKESLFDESRLGVQSNDMRSNLFRFVADCGLQVIAEISGGPTQHLIIFGLDLNADGGLGVGQLHCEAEFLSGS